MIAQRTAAQKRAPGSGNVDDSPLSREAVEVLSAARSEPAWMRDRRLDAWARYESTPLPDTAEELWRRTHPEVFPVSEAAAAPDGWTRTGISAEIPRGLVSRLGRSEEERSAVITRREGEPLFAQRDSSLAAAGVVFLDFDEALTEAPDLLRQYFMTAAVTPEAGKFEALHAAFWTSGVLAYVPRDTQVTFPLRTVTAGARGGRAQLPHLLIVAEEGSSVVVVDEQLSARGNGAALELPVTEVIVGPGARVRHVAVQESGPRARSLAITRARVARDGEFRSHLISLGGQVSKTLVETSLTEPGARSTVHGLGFGYRNQEFDHFTLQEHLAPNTASDLLYKTALRDEARSTYLGVIRIVPEAQGSAAYQTDRNLLLSGSPKADSLPVLEILADDVSCSHAAAVGPVDRDQIYYLQSRGISKADAERMLVDAFFRELTDALQLPWLSRRLRRAFESKART